MSTTRWTRPKRSTARYSPTCRPVPAGPTTPGEAAAGWTAEDSANLYGIRNWGQGYFSVNGQGHVAVHPTRSTPDRSVDLMKLVTGAYATRHRPSPAHPFHGHSASDRVVEMHNAFASAICV